MDSNGSGQSKKYEEIADRVAGPAHVEPADSEGRQWRTKRKFPGEGQVHISPSFMNDRRFKFGNSGSYDGNVLPPGLVRLPCIWSSHRLYNSFKSSLGFTISLPSETRREIYSCPLHTWSNRTGYMIAHFLKRYKSISVTEAINIFAGARPPGIYKQDYIDSLYTFYHEEKPESIVCPQTPEWKRSSDPDFYSEAVQDHNNGATPLLENCKRDLEMTNDDLLGDVVSFDQLQAMRQICYQLLKLGLPARGNPQFPGSHPVSLNSLTAITHFLCKMDSNRQITALKTANYYATWKADGTRYMMLITRDGCYLIDRNFYFRRVDMRFPCKHTNKGVPDQIHHYTLLDGEMVIDTDSNTRKQERRYLIYDVMAINQVSVVELPFHERWRILVKEVIEPRNLERESLSKSVNPYYRYDLEPFSVRRKDFWLLSTVDKLLKQFIPRLSHEADGLIFQGWDDPYVPRTHEGLLKWKYLHISVDFLFELGVQNQQLLFLNERGRKKLMERNRIVFNDVSDLSSYVGKIIECSWDSERQLWVFMRIRADKSTPNEFNTYKKVMRSIRDNINEEVLFKEIDEIIHLPMYADRIQNDIKAHQHRVSAQRSDLAFRFS
ncbi:hypothetical protein GH714_037089 [Hevea brasiliensis]|uniref:mRNA guanylyltransferase n=1 Tax=Hevea brasiliensis TaxID=3981 RepID=A0A6A6MM99_HEVBR|nr:hypothetical protein GH714_037089 [Hevea brasiliensis]